MRLRGALALLAISQVCTPSDAHAESRAALEQTDQLDLAIIDVRLRGRNVVATEFLSYSGQTGALYVPVIEFFFLLDFVVDSRSDDRFVGGWFLRENQRFKINPEAQTAIVAGQSFAIGANDVRVIEGVIHIEIAALNRLFALGAKYDRLEQSLSLNPAYLLSAEEAQRRSLRSRSKGTSSSGSDDDFEILDTPYEWLAWPHIQAEFAATYQGQTGRFDVRGSAFAIGDFLKMTGRLAASIDENRGIEGRLSFERFDPEKRLFGPLKASAVRLGDIVLNPASLIDLGSLQGVGIRVAREANDVSDSFDFTDIVGDAPPGWQAELYRDRELLAFQQVAEDGRYNFAQVPLLFGSNRFRVELYGPSGEREVVDRTIDVEAGLNRPGELTYAITALDRGSALFGQDANAQTGQFISLAGQFGREEDGPEVRINAGYGLSKNISVRTLFSFSNSPVVRPKLIGSVGLTTRALGVLANMDGAIQNGGGWAFSAITSTVLGSVSITGRHEEYVGFESGANRIGPDSYLRRRSIASLSGALGGLSWSLDGRAEVRRNGGSSRAASLRLSGVLQGISLSHQIALRDFQTGNQVRPLELIGTAAASGAVGDWRIRGGFDYDIRPSIELRRARLDISKNFGPWFVNANADRLFGDRAQSNFGLRLNREWKGIRLGTELRYQQQTNSFSGFLTLSLALDRKPQTGGLRIGRNARSDRGSLVARFYADTNANGQRDRSETAVVGPRLNFDSRGQIEVSEGSVLVEMLPTDRAVIGVVDDSELDDPFLSSGMQEFKVIARPGRALFINIPIIETGEAVISILEGGQPMTGLIVSLVNQRTNKRIRERTAFDGQAFFSSLIPGRYGVWIADKRVGSITVAPSVVTRTAISLSD